MASIETHTHKAGYVNITGNPNVGKSTIMNALVGEKLSIITSKSQTTRHRILGIVNGDDFQIVFSDTPGFLKPNYKLQESMLKFAKSALEDADILIYVTDVIEKNDKNRDILNQIKSLDIPVIVVINKVDLSNQNDVLKMMTRWAERLPKAEIIPMSATNQFNIDKLFNMIISLLPESPPFFPKDELTDKSSRFFASEIIREKILNQYHKEIPYSVEVVVEEFKESNDIIRIRSIVFVERDTQKGIIIGHQGKAIKRTGIQARKDMEAFFEKKVYLELYVKVNKDWRDKPAQLKRYGYIS